MVLKEGGWGSYVPDFGTKHGSRAKVLVTSLKFGIAVAFMKNKMELWRNGCRFVSNDSYFLTKFHVWFKGHIRPLCFLSLAGTWQLA